MIFMLLLGMGCGLVVGLLQDGDTALMIASKMGNTAVAELLKAAGKGRVLALFLLLSFCGG